METTSCPESFRRSMLCNCVWNSPKYFFSVLLFTLATCKTLGILLLHNLQDEWAMFITILLSMSAYISILRSRKKIQILMYKLLRIAKILGCFHSWNTLGNAVLVFYICIYSAGILQGVTFLFSKLAVFGHKLIRNSALIPEDLKTYGTGIRDLLVSLATVGCYGILSTLTGYY
ncbi:hypothetical protein NPIL_164521 [Nephila pilipes]|uniref:Uncharacterized protein n=1 Tax=Nephila pilipes TaxID=299642 RepID=A0A8X6QBL9_NEPPI|nr:hypothetical protein NPIL_164521 [Nephila pilipes]